MLPIIKVFHRSVVVEIARAFDAWGAGKGDVREWRVPLMAAFSHCYNFMIQSSLLSRILLLFWGFRWSGIQ
jgi:hypothetical protein